MALIDKQTALDALNEYFCRISKLKHRELNKGEKAISLDVAGVIQSLPTKVICCKDCKHWNLQVGNVKGDGLGSCDFHNVNLVTGEGFCYWADRRGEGGMKYIRYRFKTKSVDDPRPLIDMGKINMPWWCTGYAANDTYAIIVCYLPKNHDKSIYFYWDDAFDIDKEEVDKIIYTDRFPKPDWVD